MHRPSAEEVLQQLQRLEFDDPYQHFSLWEMIALIRQKDEEIDEKDQEIRVKNQRITQASELIGQNDEQIQSLKAQVQHLQVCTNPWLAWCTEILVPIVSVNDQELKMW